MEEKQSVEIELSTDQFLSLELVRTKKQLLDAEQRLTIIKLKENQRASESLVRDEAVLLASIATANGVISKFRVLGLKGKKLVVQPQ